MPPKKTSTRLDITLPISLVEMLRAHADREGLTVSAVIGQAVRAHLEGPAPSPSSAHQMTLPSDIDSLIRQRVEAALQEHLSRLPAPVTPEISVPETVTITKKPSPVHAGKVLVPEDIRKAIIDNGYTAAQMANVIRAIFNPDNDTEIKTITRGTLQGFAKGTASMTSPEYCEQIVKAVEYLESSGKQCVSNTV